MPPSAEGEPFGRAVSRIQQDTGQVRIRPQMHGEARRAVCQRLASPAPLVPVGNLLPAVSGASHSLADRADRCQCNLNRSEVVSSYMHACQPIAVGFARHARSFDGHQPGRAMRNRCTQPRSRHNDLTGRDPIGASSVPAVRSAMCTLYLFERDSPRKDKARSMPEGWIRWLRRCSSPLMPYPLSSRHRVVSEPHSHPR